MWQIFLEKLKDYLTNLWMMSVVTKTVL